MKQENRVITWMLKKVKDWLGVEEEIELRVSSMRAYLAEQHRQAVSKDTETLRRLIAKLIRVEWRVRTEFCGDITYSTTISDGLLLDSLNDRESLTEYLAQEIAHQLMRVQPVRR